MLRLEHVTAGYDRHVPVLRDVSLTVDPGRVTCILGSNGAGKTTLTKTIVSVVRPTQGRVFDGEQRIDGRPTHEIIRRGIVVVPEGRRLFPQLTVHDNLRIGAYHERDGARIQMRMERVFTIFPILGTRHDQIAGTLSGGEQGMLAVGRALMAEPRVLILDDPSLGLAPLLVRELFRVVKRINEAGVTILLIEQNARKAIEIASRGYVLQKGAVIAEGSSAELRRSDALRRAYL
jgi:branched-chain amino acid transport system ATP-binding protein